MANFIVSFCPPPCRPLDPPMMLCTIAYDDDNADGDGPVTSCDAGRMPGIVGVKQASLRGLWPSRPLSNSTGAP